MHLAHLNPVIPFVLVPSRPHEGRSRSAELFRVSAISDESGGRGGSEGGGRDSRSDGPAPGVSDASSNDAARDEHATRTANDAAETIVAHLVAHDLEVQPEITSSGGDAILEQPDEVAHEAIDKYSEVLKWND